MPRNKGRRIRGGAEGGVLNSGPPGGSGGSGSGSGENISFNIKNAPVKLAKIKGNPNQVVTVAFLCIIFILVLLFRAYAGNGIGVIGNKLSISVIAFNLGACLIGYYLLIGGNGDGFIVDMYLYLSIAVFGYWLWLLFFSDSFSNIDKAKAKEAERDGDK